MLVAGAGRPRLFSVGACRGCCNLCAVWSTKPQIYANLRKPHALRACSNFETSSLVNREPIHGVQSRLSRDAAARWEQIIHLLFLQISRNLRVNFNS